ncbi:MAG: hypothetical protein ACI909_003452, partial [Planctomycetota bacterium]
NQHQQSSPLLVPTLCVGMHKLLSEAQNFE